MGSGLGISYKIGAVVFDQTEGDIFDSIGFKERAFIRLRRISQNIQNRTEIRNGSSEPGTGKIGPAALEKSVILQRIAISFCHDIKIADRLIEIFFCHSGIDRQIEIDSSQTISSIGVVRRLRQFFQNLSIRRDHILQFVFGKTQRIGPVHHQFDLCDSSGIAFGSFRFIAEITDVMQNHIFLQKIWIIFQHFLIIRNRFFRLEDLHFRAQFCHIKVEIGKIRAVGIF